MASPKTPTRPKTAGPSPGGPKKTPAAKPAKPVKVPTPLVRCWATDPRDTLRIRQENQPALPGAKLAIELTSARPEARLYSPNTTEFRYWVAAEALRRAADFWSAAGCEAWERTSIGKTLKVQLDAGQQMNAYYSREDGGLSFYHFIATDPAHPGHTQTVYFGESPDILAHELGHAVLDAVRPDLWDQTTAEYTAFHESFGDMSAVLTALQVPEVRDAVVAETQGQVWRNSLVARLAEEVGGGIRQIYPQYADADCLRNVSIRWMYRDPTELSAEGPNTMLTSEPHNFSRVFTGAFYLALGQMVRAVAGATTVAAAHVLEASQDMGQLLLKAVAAAPLRTRFFQAVADQLVIAANIHPLHGPAYVKAMTTALVRHGLLASPPPPPTGRTINSFAHAVAFAAIGTDEQGTAHPEAQVPAELSVNGLLLGVEGSIRVQGPALDEESTQRPLGVRAALPFVSDRERAVQHFVESLARRGRIEVSKVGGQAESFLHLVQSTEHATHRLETTEDGSTTLRRVRVDCGCNHR